MILLTGASGTLGTHIVESKLFSNLLTPSSDQLDVSNSESVRNFFQNNKIESIIHCAAIARISECEENPEKAIKTNIKGTCNLVNEVLRQERENSEEVRFIFISTDGVYEGTKGGYSEKDFTMPYSRYGWTKLGAECSVNVLSNYCIIRTSFFDPEKINFYESPEDIYTSKIPIQELVNSIRFLLRSDFAGTINIGGKRKSYYELYKKYIPNLKPCKYESLKNNPSIKLPKDSSMDISLWEKIKK